MITSSHFNRLYRSLRVCVHRSVCKLQYCTLNQTVGYCMSETISQRSHLANYFEDQNKSVQRHWIVVRWQHLLVAPTRIFWREVLLTQADCSSRDSRLSLLSAYCLCVWRCRQRLYATAGDSRVLPAVHWLSQSTNFLFFYGHFSTEKRKETKMRMSFSAEK